MAFRVLVPRLIVAEERLAAVGNPFYRASDAPGGPQHQRFFRVELTFQTETAPHIAGDHPEPGFRFVENVLGES